MSKTTHFTIIFIIMLLANIIREVYDISFSLYLVAIGASAFMIGEIYKQTNEK